MSVWVTELLRYCTDLFLRIMRTYADIKHGGHTTYSTFSNNKCFPLQSLHVFPGNWTRKSLNAFLNTVLVINYCCIGCQGYWESKMWE